MRPRISVKSDQALVLVARMESMIVDALSYSGLMEDMPERKAELCEPWLDEC